MRANSGSLIRATVCLLVATLVAISARAQNASASSLIEELTARYRLAKLGTGSIITEAGAVLVIQKEGIIGVAPGSVATCPAIYSDGALHAPSGDDNSPCGRDARKLSTGDRVYAVKIDVDPQKDRVSLLVVGCGYCGATPQSAAYKSAVVFQYPSGYIVGADSGQLEDVIGQVLALQNETVDEQQQTPNGSGSPTALTNADIIKLLQAKLPDSVVLAKIKSSTCDFDTSADALIKLKQAGVSDSVLQAMVEASTQPNPAPSSQPSPEPAQGAQETPLSGQYFLQETGAHLQLNPDGSFSLQGADGHVSPGHFTVSGDTLVLTYVATGRSSSFSIQGDKLYANSGKAWVRQGDAPAKESEPLPSCGNYDVCMKMAQTLFESSQWDRALSRFQEASQLDASKGDAWAGIGNADLQLGQYDDAGATWDKALQAGSTLTLSFCHAKALCGDTGSLSLNAKEISFVNKKGEKELVAPAAEVTSEGAVPVNSNPPAYYLQIHSGGKNYRFYYLPKGIRCNLGFACPEPGSTQQKVVADYLHERFARIAAGDFGPRPSKP